MANYVLTFEGRRCPDGVEAFLGDPLTSKGVPFEDSASMKLRYRTKRREVYRRRLEAPDELIVTEFLNTYRFDPNAKQPWWEEVPEASEEETAAVADFITKYGFLEPGHDVYSLDLVRRSRLDFWIVWRRIASGNLKAAVAKFRSMMSQEFFPSINLDMNFRDNKPVLSLPITSLAGFMLMETALVLTGGGQVMRCEQCGIIFNTGSGTGRRNTAMYCANRCRVAAQRLRKLNSVKKTAAKSRKK